MLHSIPGTPHLIHRHVQKRPAETSFRSGCFLLSFESVKISVVSPNKHKPPDS
jgi:hypothetical protein